MGLRAVKQSQPVESILSGIATHSLIAERCLNVLQDIDLHTNRKDAEQALKSIHTLIATHSNWVIEQLTRGENL